MKRPLLVICAVGLALALMSCEVGLGPAGEQDVSDEVLAAAQAATMEVANLAMVARASGDYTDLEAYLASNDPDREVRALLEEHGMFTSAPAARGVSGLDFDDPAFMNGDVLVCKGSSTGISNLMDMILVRGYGHAGILRKGLAMAGAPCVLSADIDYLGDLDPGNGGLTYETPESWQSNNDTVAVLRMGSTEPNLPSDTDLIDAFFTAYNRGAGTVYAFFGYAGAAYGAFVPIPRTDATYWYCSKTAWKALKDSGGPDAEDANFYFRDGKWKVLKDSLLYSLLRVYLFNKAGYRWWQWWGWAKIEPYAIATLKGALAELITPDELRAYDGFGYVKVYGDTSFDTSEWTGYSGY